MKSSFCRYAIAGVLSLAAGSLAQANSFDIMNGEAAVPGAYPWLVSIGDANNSDALMAHECGGSLIAERWVLTAAHCFSANPVARNTAIVIGRNRLSEHAGQRIVAKNIYRHPGYNSTTSDNDIALVELSEAVNAAQPVRLAAPAQTSAVGTLARAAGRGGLASPMNYLAERYALSADCSNDPEACLSELARKGVSQKATLQTVLLANGLGDASKGIGFKELVALAQANGASATLNMSYDELYAALSGANVSLAAALDTVLQATAGSDEIRQVDLPLTDKETCQAATGMSITSNMLCAGYADQPKDTCQGDSGGPLFVRNAQNSDWQQVGVVSFGGVCGASFGVYSKVANYLDWIAGHVPHFNSERLMNWAETVAAPVLKAQGNERSISVAPYWARCYSASGTCIGEDGTNLVFYDGQQLQALPTLNDWIDQARQAGY